ncbi:uncharacterized protein V6R79_026391 [Siganus canaliculatus]
MFSPTLTVAVFLAAASCWTTDAATEGSMINLLSLEHGEASPEDCAAGLDLQLTEKPCLSPQIAPFSKLICDKMQRCEVPMPDKRMFHCDYPENTFFMAKYACNQQDLFWLLLHVGPLLQPVSGSFHCLLSFFCGPPLILRFPAAHHTSVACPAEGSMINLVALEHGEASPGHCAAGNDLVLSQNYCLQPLLYPWAKLICNKMERCRLPVPDVRMFKCEFSENTFIVAKYACYETDLEVKTLEVCDGGEAELKCESGTIDIMKASYGRFDQSTCTETPSDVTYCASPSVNVQVQEMCNDKAECTFPVNQSGLGKPLDCDELPKYLHVKYVCG